MNQLDRVLVSALDPFMGQHGFKFLRSRSIYLRKHADGFDEFTWGSYRLAAGPKWEAGYYEGHYGIGLRHDAVERLYDVLDLTYGEENKRYRSTIYRAVGGYFPFNSGRDRELCLRFDHLEEDAAETAKLMKMMLMGDGLAWFARYADPVLLSRDINDPPGLGVEPHHLVNNTAQRPLCGVAAACVGEPHRVGDLVESYLRDARKLDELSVGRTKERFAPKLEQQLSQIVGEARRKGYDV